MFTVLFIVSCVYVVIGAFIIHSVTAYGPMEISKLKFWRVTAVGGVFMSCIWLISYTFYRVKITYLKPLASWLKDEDKNPF